MSEDIKDVFILVLVLFIIVASLVGISLLYTVLLFSWFWVVLLVGLLWFFWSFIFSKFIDKELGE